MVERSEYAQPIRRVYPLWMQDQGGRDMTQAVSDTPRTDAVLSSDHYAKDLLELARTLERELAALREGVPRDAMTDVVRRLYKWLEAPSDKGGCNLDHVPQSFMDAWQDADLRLEEIDRRAAQEGTP
jgi:hypothetical protein